MTSSLSLCRLHSRTAKKTDRNKSSGLSAREPDFLRELLSRVTFYNLPASGACTVLFVFFKCRAFQDSSFPASSCIYGVYPRKKKIWHKVAVPRPFLFVSQRPKVCRLFDPINVSTNISSIPMKVTGAPRVARVFILAENAETIVDSSCVKVGL